MGSEVPLTGLTILAATFLDTVVPILGLTVWQLIILALIIVATLAAGLLVRALLRTIFARTPFPEDMEKRIARTSMYLVWIIGLLFIPGVLGVDLGAVVIYVFSLTTILTAILIAIVFVIIASVVSGILTRVFKRTALSEDLEKGLISASRVLVYVIGVFVVFSALGMDLGALILSLGAFSIALSFALSDIIKNITAGVLVQTDKPFHVGDTIKVGGIEGEVTKTKIRTTLLRTEEGHLAYIPNIWFTTKEIINKTSRGETETPTEGEPEP